MGTTTDSRHPSDWERQREQLSALVDGELSLAERSQLEQHLATCPECQEELARLRRVRTLMRALPSPSMPRSFALPAETTTPMTPHGARPDTIAGRERAGSVALYRASRWVGSIAATIGLALLLGSALMGLLSSGHVESASTASFQMGGVQSTHAPYTPSNGTTQPGAITAQPAPPTPAATLVPTQIPVQPEQNTNSDGDALPLGPLAGAGLLAGGVILLVAGWAARRRD